MESSNEYLKELPIDHLYHLGLDSSMDLVSMFQDVKYVLMGGSATRIKGIMERAIKELPHMTGEGIPQGLGLATIGKNGELYYWQVWWMSGWVY